MHTPSRDLPTLYVLVSYIEVVCCAILEIDSCAVETRITKFSHGAETREPRSVVGETREQGIGLSLLNLTENTPTDLNSS